MAISKDQNLIAVAGNVQLGEGRFSNKIYLFNMCIFKDKFELALVDSIEFESQVEPPRSRVPDVVSALWFLETDKSTFLIGLTRESAKINFMNIVKDEILEVCEECDFSGVHN